VIKIGELLVIAAGFIHGLNGIRIALTSFGIGSGCKNRFLSLILIISILLTTCDVRLFACLAAAFFSLK
jgi:succinate dehydrogenase/fumarate reductase cytochrome b subunit